MSRSAPRIWRYVVASDSGMAPCSDNGLMTLACCKPMIRRYARPGDWVVGFAPKRAGLGRVIWAGRVSEVVSLGEYERRYRGRDDAIYLAVRNPDGSETLKPLRDDYHATARLRARDIGGLNALVFDPYVHGATLLDPPEAIAALAHYHVGQSTRGSTLELIAELARWIGVAPRANAAPRATRHGARC